MAERGYHSRDKYGNPRAGETVDNLLTKIEDLHNATQHVDGTMSANDKYKLDSLEDDQELSIEEIARLIDF